MHALNLVRAFVVAAMVALMMPTVQAAAVDCSGIEAKIAAAKTAADHEAIASCYDEMAKDATAKADEHKKMGEAYRKGGGAPVGKLGLPQHCDQFIKSFQNEASMYKEMAAAHRKMAKDAK